jgi:GT2 family glycosyltransferase
MSYSVIIPSARAENLIACVTALGRCEPGLPPERIIVVDDGARATAEPRLGPLAWVSGEKPFIFARNVNLGIRACQGDVILLNDDAELITPGGFSAWSELMSGEPKLGVCSAGIRGIVGNPRQQASSPDRLAPERATLAFVCVYIPRRVLDQVGLLDERFTGYGFDDDDYCERAVAAGWQLGVWHGCVVSHDGTVPSTFRGRPDFPALFEKNRRIRELQLAARRGRTQPAEKPAADEGSAIGTPPEPPETSRRVDILYLAQNRLEFTRVTFDALIANTDWKQVRELVVYDDGSKDGTREWLQANIDRVPASHRLLFTSFQSPVTAMVHFIRHSVAPILAKLDNDAVYPPGWLEESLAVLDDNPDLALLGIEAMNHHEESSSKPRGYEPADFISGLGLYRRDVFRRSRPQAFQKYYGFEEWQMDQGRRLKRGWIRPALPVFLLDRMPIEPWRGLSLEYARRGWQRPPWVYPEDCTLWHWRFPPGSRADAVRLNICWQGDPLPGYTNVSLGQAGSSDAVDLSRPWPWQDGAASEVRAWHVVERLTDKIQTMNELWRILRHGGTAEIVLPTTEGAGAFQDPTHVSYWNRRSFLYYEDGSPYRERHATRYGIKARFEVVSERTEISEDGPKLSITLRALKNELARNENAAETRVTAVAAPRTEFVCAMRVKNEAEHIREAIESVLPLCERVVLFDDHSTDATVDIARSFGERCSIMSSPFEGLDEARDKNHVLEHLIRLDPDWVLWIDGDEVLERMGPAVLRAAAHLASKASYSLRVAYLWDDAAQVRVDGIYGNFSRPSFFRLRGHGSHGIRFRATGAGANFHCGNVPTGLSGSRGALSVRLKHYGYLTSEQRLQKYLFYTSRDPNNHSEDEYRHIAGIPGARHAPGPPVFVPWRE